MPLKYQQKVSMTESSPGSPPARRGHTLTAIKKSQCEADKKNPCDDIQARIRRQSATIDHLTTENYSMKRDIAQSRDIISEQHAVLLGKEMRKLADVSNNLQRSIADEQATQKSLQERIAKVELEVNKLRAHTDPSGALIPERKSTNHIGTLENRLENKLQKVSECAFRNKCIKNEITNMRKERAAFESMYKKACKELTWKKANVVMLIEAANQAFAARECAQRHLALVKSEANAERKSFDKEWQELQLLLFDVQEHAMQEHISTTDSLFEGKRNSERIGTSKIKPELELKRSSLETTTATLDEYESAISKISAATGLNNLEELIEAFNSAEKHNFSLFSYINSLANETESLKRTIRAYRGELSMGVENLYKSNMRMQEAIKNLETDSVSLRGCTKQLENASQSIYDQINSVMTHIVNIYQLVTQGEEKLRTYENFNQASFALYFKAIDQAIESQSALCQGSCAANIVATEKDLGKGLYGKVNQSDHSNMSGAKNQGNVSYVASRTLSLEEILEDETIDQRRLERQEWREKISELKKRKDEKRQGINKADKP